MFLYENVDWPKPSLKDGCVGKKWNAAQSVVTVGAFQQVLF